MAKSSFDSRELTSAVHAVLRTGTVLSDGSMVLPYNSSVVWPERRATRAPPLRQWMLERETFEDAVVEQYNSLNDGVVRELVAGTGVGKTTKMPYLIAKAHQINGIVLTPNDVVPMTIVRYLEGYFASLGGEVNAVLLRTDHYTSPPEGPVIYFSSAATFLGRLAARPSLIIDLGIDFIYLDESHEKTASYEFFKYAVTAKIISGCKVFYGTATASSDISMESGGVGRTISKVPYNLFSVNSPKMADARSPLHFKNIVDRTMVFMATDGEIMSWFEYYQSHDVPVFQVSMGGGNSSLNELPVFLEAQPLCVVLMHGMYRTAVTYNVDTAICTGYQLKAVTDFYNYAVDLKRLPVTQSLRTQAMGRVGRFKQGRGIYADVDVSPESTDIDDDTAFYVYLWAQVFSLKINDPLVSRFSGLTSDMSNKAAAVLLHSRIPPFLLMPYVGNNGFFVGWAGVAQYVLFKHGFTDDGDSSPVNTGDWTTYSTGVVPYVRAPFEFKSAIKFPREWNAIPAYAWALFEGDEMVPSGMGSRSVISAVPDDVAKRATFGKSRMSLNTVSSHDIWTSGASEKPDEKPLPERPITRLHRNSVTSALSSPAEEMGVPNFDIVRSAYSVRDTMPAIGTPPPRYQHDRNRSIEEVVKKAEAIETWRDHTVIDTSPGKASSIYRVGSDSSSDRSAMKLRKVNPVKYKDLKFYPFDNDLFDQFVQSEGATRHDKGRVNKLLDGRENVSNMHSDATLRKERQASYFMSVIRVHNAAVIQKFQLSANTTSSTAKKLMMFANGDMKNVSNTVSETARLLLAFQVESYFVGVDKRALKSSDSSGLVIAQSYDYDILRAKVMMSMGSQQVIYQLQQIKSRFIPYIQDEKMLANAWLVGDAVLTASHAFDADEILPAFATDLLYTSEDADFVLFKPQQSGRPVLNYRAAGINERVYIVTYDVAQEELIVLGDYQYTHANDIGYVRTVLEKGGSGSLVVSVYDGAVVGMYVSFLANTNEGGVSLVVPAQQIFQHVV